MQSGPTPDHQDGTNSTTCTKLSDSLSLSLSPCPRCQWEWEQKKNHVLIGSKQSSYQLQPSKFAAAKHYKQPNGGRYDYVKYEFQDDI